MGRVKDLEQRIQEKNRKELEGLERESLKSISLLVPESWFYRLREQARINDVSVDGLICMLLQKEYGLKGKKRSRGRPKK